MKKNRIMSIVCVIAFLTLLIIRNILEFYHETHNYGEISFGIILPLIEISATKVISYYMLLLFFFSSFNSFLSTFLIKLRIGYYTLCICVIGLYSIIYPLFIYYYYFRLGSIKIVLYLGKYWEMNSIFNAMILSLLLNINRTGGKYEKE